MKRRDQKALILASVILTLAVSETLGGCTPAKDPEVTTEESLQDTHPESSGEENSKTGGETGTDRGTSPEENSENKAGSETENGAGSETERETGEEQKNVTPCKDYYKKESWGSPISPNVFCADPTAIEYNGRLYVFGTNDQQQFDIGGPGSENTYEKIKSLVIYSSDDLINWTYHGVLDVSKVAPWIYNSWAPSIVSRVEEDGLTHFYMYFSNTGAGVGVITATDPLGPWTDPLGKPLISGKTPGLGECPIPFDPGVCFDDEGRGWLTFGGGQASSGSEYMPGVARIVRLGEDMVSLDSEIAEIPAPYFNEASELNFMNGTWVYTYNTSWKDRTVWEDPEQPKPTTCSMVYMTSRDPLKKESWTYRGEYFSNPGTFGMGWGNNHTHLQKFLDRYYLIYHCQIGLEKMNMKGGYRNLAVTLMNVDEETQTIEKGRGSIYANYTQLKTADPYQTQPGAFFATAAGIDYLYEGSPMKEVVGVRAAEDGAWTLVRGVDFGKEAPKSLQVTLSGSGSLELRVGSIESAPVMTVPFSCEDAACVTTEIPSSASEALSGEKDLFFVLTSGNTELRSWQFQ